MVLEAQGFSLEFHRVLKERLEVVAEEGSVKELLKEGKEERRHLVVAEEVDLVSHLGGLHLAKHQRREVSEAVEVEEVGLESRPVAQHLAKRKEDKEVHPHLEAVAEEGSVNHQQRVRKEAHQLLEAVVVEEGLASQVVALHLEKHPQREALVEEAVVEEGSANLRAHKEEHQRLVVRLVAQHLAKLQLREALVAEEVGSVSRAVVVEEGLAKHQRRVHKEAHQLLEVVVAEPHLAKHQQREALEAVVVEEEEGLASRAAAQRLAKQRAHKEVRRRLVVLPAARHLANQHQPREASVVVAAGLVRRQAVAPAERSVKRVLQMVRLHLERGQVLVHLERKQMVYPLFSNRRTNQLQLI